MDKVEEIQWCESKRPPIFQREFTSADIESFKQVMLRSYGLDPETDASQITYDFVKVLSDADRALIKASQRERAPQNEKPSENESPPVGIGGCSAEAGAETDSDGYHAVNMPEDHDDPQDTGNFKFTDDQKRWFGNIDYNYIWLVYYLNCYNVTDSTTKKRPIFSMKVPIPERIKEKAAALIPYKSGYGQASEQKNTMSLNTSDLFKPTVYVPSGQGQPGQVPPVTVEEIDDVPSQPTQQTQPEQTSQVPAIEPIKPLLVHTSRPKRGGRVTKVIKPI